jgi:recombination protein RecA
MSLAKLLKDVRKSTGSTSFKDSKYSEITDWIDTGSYGLNRIISGDIHRGIPSGRVILMGGESQTGKSFLAAKIIINALKQGFDHVFYFDSEGGSLKDFFEKQGADLDKIEHILLESCEDATIKILGVYTTINEYKTNNPDAKFLLVTDSVGALVPTKLLTDAAKGKQAQDMGSRAKLINNLVKGCIIPALKSNSSMLFLNHVYDNPAEMFASKIKTQSGGKQLQYIPHVSLQCTKKLIKAESNDEEFYGGNTLKFFTTKNRIVRPFLDAELFIDFKKGIGKWEGLVDAAMKYGFIEQSGSYYTVPSFDDKKRYMKELLRRDDIWETFIDDFNEKSLKDLQYSSEEEREKFEKLEKKELENED